MEKTDLVDVHMSWRSPEDGSTVNYGALMRLDRLSQMIDLMDRGQTSPEDDE